MDVIGELKERRLMVLARGVPKDVLLKAVGAIEDVSWLKPGFCVSDLYSLEFRNFELQTPQIIATAVMRGKIEELAREEPMAVEFRRALPWNYDDTRVLDAEIARHLTVVRRKGDAFYIGGLTGDAVHETSVSLDFLAPGRDYVLTLLTDDPADASVPQGYRRETRTVRKGDMLVVKMSASGGFCGTIADKQVRP